MRHENVSCTRGDEVIFATVCVRKVCVLWQHHFIIVPLPARGWSETRLQPDCVTLPRSVDMGCCTFHKFGNEYKTKRGEPLFQWGEFPAHIHDWVLFPPTGHSWDIILPFRLTDMWMWVMEGQMKVEFLKWENWESLFQGISCSPCVLSPPAPSDMSWGSPEFSMFRMFSSFLMWSQGSSYALTKIRDGAKKIRSWRG